MTLSAPAVEACRTVGRDTGLPPECLATVLEVETGGREVEPYDGRTPALLPEPRVFYRLLPENLRAHAVAAGLAMASGTPDYTAIAGSSQQRVERLAAMVGVHEEAGYGACSYGLPQIMGEHGRDLGYGTARGLFEHFRDGGVHEQVSALAHLIDHMGIREDLVAGRWQAVARAYNGPAWARNGYADKLARAHATWSARMGTGQVDFASDPTMLQLGDHGASVESLQRVLVRLRWPVRVDGDYGTATQTQVLGFQAANGLDRDGKVGPETRRALATAKPRAMGARALATMRSVARTTVIGVRARAGKALALGVGTVQVAHVAGVGPSEVLDHIQTVTDTVSRAKTTYEGLVDVLPSPEAVPHGLASVALATATSPTAAATVAGCVGVWAVCHGILRARTDDERSGSTVSG